jgi:hypothetical protein
VSPKNENQSTERIKNGIGTNPMPLLFYGTALQEAFASQSLFLWKNGQFP